MKVINAETIQRELGMRKREYALALESMSSKVAEAQAKLANDRISNHDGFNLGAQASELQALATRIEFCENLIRFSEEAPCGK